MELGKKVGIFDWEWGQNSAPRGMQNIPCHEKKEKTFAACEQQRLCCLHAEKISFTLASASTQSDKCQ